MIRKRVQMRNTFANAIPLFAFSLVVFGERTVPRGFRFSLFSLHVVVCEKRVSLLGDRGPPLYIIMARCHFNISPIWHRSGFSVPARRNKTPPTQGCV
jgi:hypothetical protein